MLVDLIDDIGKQSYDEYRDMQIDPEKRKNYVMRKLKELNPEDY